jgi:hypothetical protein
VANHGGAWLVAWHDLAYSPYNVAAALYVHFDFLKRNPSANGYVRLHIRSKLKTGQIIQIGCCSIWHADHKLSPIAEHHGIAENRMEQIKFRSIWYLKFYPNFLQFLGIVAVVRYILVVYHTCLDIPSMRHTSAEQVA